MIPSYSSAVQALNEIITGYNIILIVIRTTVYQYQFDTLILIWNSNLCYKRCHNNSSKGATKDTIF